MKTLGALLASLSLLAVVVLGMASRAEAQTLDYRVDFDVPSVTLSASPDASSAMIGVSGAVRFAHRSGHGARAAVSYADELHSSSGLLGPSDANAELTMFDLAYAYRLRLSGDDRGGVGLDFFGGPSFGIVTDRQANNGLCFGGCSSPPVRVFRDRLGNHLGLVVGASLDGRYRGFVAGIDVGYHALFALDGGAGAIDTHAFTAGAHIGFGFY
jgi:hypothetical protein